MVGTLNLNKYMAKLHYYYYYYYYYDWFGLSPLQLFEQKKSSKRSLVTIVNNKENTK